MRVWGINIEITSSSSSAINNLTSKNSKTVIITPWIFSERRHVDLLSERIS